ncbi:hypothetical protein F5146DRAFT_1006898 [Armillaria mellea]|nr:hypothetical protein F5146DRAFT_1006898 [Armillaria mellea]
MYKRNGAAARAFHLKQTRQAKSKREDQCRYFMVRYFQSMWVSSLFLSKPHIHTEIRICLGKHERYLYTFVSSGQPQLNLMDRSHGFAKAQSAAATVGSNLIAIQGDALRVNSGSRHSPHQSPGLQEVLFVVDSIMHGMKYWNTSSRIEDPDGCSIARRAEGSPTSWRRETYINLEYKGPDPFATAGSPTKVAPRDYHEWRDLKAFLSDIECKTKSGMDTEKEEFQLRGLLLYASYAHKDICPGMAKRINLNSR